MRTNNEVLIIGGGIIGICAAYYLQKSGWRVTLVERKTLGFGSSTGNAGLIVPSHFTPMAAPGVIAKGMKWMFNPESPFYIKPRLDRELLTWLWKFRGACNESQVKKAAPLLLKLHLESKKLYREMAELPGIEFGLATRGLLMLCNSESGWHELEKMTEKGRKIGLKSRMMSAPEVHEMDDSLQTSAKSGAYFPEDAHLDPGKFISEMSDFLRKKGVVIRTGVAATGFDLQNGRIRAVRTDCGEMRADQFVLAAGSFSPALARELRIKLPIQPAKGYSVTLHHPKNMPQTPLILEEAKVAVTPMGDKLRIAGTLEFSGLDYSINPRRVKAMLNAIPEYLPEVDLSGIDAIEPWAGLRPCSPDGLPFLGRSSRCENLIIAAGHAMIGVSLAPITGKIVADLINDREPGIDISALNVQRFG